MFLCARCFHLHKEVRWWQGKGQKGVQGKSLNVCQLAKGKTRADVLICALCVGNIEAETYNMTFEHGVH